MKKYVFVVGGSTDGKMASISEIADSVRNKLSAVGIFIITEASLVRPNKKTYEYTFYANFPETAVTFMAERLLEVFDLVVWKEMKWEESCEWYK